MDQNSFWTRFRYPGVFDTIAEVRQHVQKFIVKPPNDLVILCPALISETAEGFLKTEKKNPEPGVYEMLEKRESLTD